MLDTCPAVVVGPFVAGIVLLDSPMEVLSRSSSLAMSVFDRGPSQENVASRLGLMGDDGGNLSGGLESPATVEVLVDVHIVSFA